MKVLLINPPIKNIIPLEMPLFVRENEGLFPPLGLMYIASYLNRYENCEVRILDTLAERMDYTKIEKYIWDFLPRIVGITTHTHNLIDVILTAELVKKINREIYVCLGGSHINTFFQEAINIPSVDFVVLGEGEITFTKLVSSLKKKSNLKKVKGLLFKENGQSINTGLRGNSGLLDHLPFPDRKTLNYEKYYNILGRKSIMTTMITSRGCPYHCSFCSTPKGSYRVRSPKNVVDELEECLILGIKEVHFVDDTFNVYPERVIKICDEIIQRRLRVNWSFRGRIDKINEFLLRKVKASGCYRIHFGVETSDNEGLKQLRKGITIEEIRQVFKWTHNLGINTVASFLIGCPHEKAKKDVMKTIEFSKEINPDFALFNILRPYPATEIYEQGLKKGVIKKDYWREFAISPKKEFKAQFWQEWFSKEELFDLLKLAYWKFYFRPKILLRVLGTSQNLKVLSGRLKSGWGIFK